MSKLKAAAVINFSKATYQLRSFKMFCMECGEKITDAAKFCAKCGAKVEQVALSSSQSAKSTETESVSAPVKEAQYNKKNIITIVAILLGTALVIGYWTNKHSGKGEQQDTQQSSTNSNSNQNEQLSKCISAAHQSEYPDGRCAYGFIEACMTGSRQAMGENLRFDKAQGMAGPGSGPCTNMPDKYVNAYDQY